MLNRALAAAVVSGLVGLGIPASARGQVVSPLGLGDTVGTLVGTLAGTLVGRGDGQPIPYATVTLVTVDRTIFASATGAFRFSQLAPGRYALRARQIGYAPLDTSIVVTPGPGETAISLSMRRIAVRLAEVGIVGQRRKGCVATGVPDSAVNPTLATLFGQVRENVDRFRLVLDEYPFRFDREERRAIRLEPGGDSMPVIDTVTYESRARRPYSVGGIIYYDYDATGLQKRYMYLPTFRDLADPAFLSAHCFTYGGTESPTGTNGPSVVRVDFRPASYIKAPDVEGTIYLDAQRFIVRRAVVAMTRPQAAHPPIVGLSATTTFRELVPLVPVFDSVHSNEMLPVGHRSRGDLSFHGDESETVKRTAVEDDRILHFTFEDRTPGDQGPATHAGQPGNLSGREAPTLPSTPQASAVAVASTATPTLIGRVLQADGTPVAAATVGLFGTTDTTLTSDSGAFTLTAPTRGAHMLWARRLGFLPARVPVTVASTPSRPIAVMLSRVIPTLATVTTTAEARSAMKEIGLDRRMRAGQGQFLTYDQIVRRHASKVSDLLQGLRGIRLLHEQFQFETSVVGTRGVGSCVSFAVDGVPQSVLSDHDVDEMVDVAGVAAIEVYSSAERPAGMGGLEERPLPDPRQPLPAIDTAGQQCTLVVIWTRGKLGLPDVAEANPSVVGVEARVRAVFPNVALCEPRPADDTIEVALYASLEAERPARVSDTAWSRYTGSVLAAVRGAFTMPSDLPLAAFSQPFQLTAHASARAGAKAAPMLTAPGFWSVISFTLDSAGHVVSDRVAAASLSGVGDTTVLAAVSDAEAAHAFPTGLSAAPHAPIRFDLVVSTGQPMVGDRVTTLGRVSMPIWTLRRRVTLADGDQPKLAPESVDPSSIQADSAVLEFIVSDSGTVVLPTVRAIGGGPLGSGHASYREFLARLGRSLPKFRYDAALIGACPVPQLLVQPFMWRQF